MNLRRAGKSLPLRPGQGQTEGPCQNMMFSFSFFLLGTEQRREQCLVHPLISVIKLRFVNENGCLKQPATPGCSWHYDAGAQELCLANLCANRYSVRMTWYLCQVYSACVTLYPPLRIARWSLLCSCFTIMWFKDWTPTCGVPIPVCMVWGVQSIQHTNDVTQVTLCCCGF